MSLDASTALRQQLYETVMLLASEEGRIEERLARAYFTHIRNMDISAFPADARREYEAIHEELNQMYPEPGRHDGVDQNTAVTLAQRIILIYDAMIR